MSLRDYENAVHDFWFEHDNIHRLMEEFVVDGDDSDMEAVEEEFYESYTDDRGLLSLDSLMGLVRENHDNPKRIYQFLEEYEANFGHLHQGEHKGELWVDVEGEDEGYFSEEGEEILEDDPEDLPEGW